MSPRAWDRRSFLRSLGAGALLTAGGVGVRPPLLEGAIRLTSPRRTVRMGWVLPDPNHWGPGSGLFRGTEAGMVLGREEAEEVAALLGVELDVTVERVGAPDEMGAAGDRLMAHGVQVLVGAVDTPAARDLARKSSRNGVLFVDALAWGADSPRDGAASCAPPAFRVGADESAGLGLVLEALSANAPAGPAILVGDPGDPQVARARRALAHGTHAPRIVDAFLPADRITEEIRAPGTAASTVDTPLLLVGSTALAWAFEPGSAGAAPSVFATTPLRPGDPPPVLPIHSPALWHPALTRFGAAQLNERHSRRFGGPMDPASWAGWFAVKLLWEMALREGEAGEGGAPPSQRLGDGATRFDGHKGVGLAFRSDGLLRQPLYLVRTDPDGGSEVVHEGPAVSSGTPFAEAFDALGPPGAECRSGRLVPPPPAPSTSGLP